MNQDDEFWSELGRMLQPRVPEAHWAAQRIRIVSRMTPEGSGPGFAGWWKVPALTLASCAVYALCVETRLVPSRRPPVLALMTDHREAREVSTLIFGGAKAGREEMLAILFEGAGK